VGSARLQIGADALLCEGTDEAAAHLKELEDLVRLSAGRVVRVIIDVKYICKRQTQSHRREGLVKLERQPHLQGNLGKMRQERKEQERVRRVREVEGK